MGVMRVFTNLNIKTKLLATFAIMVMLIIAGSIIGAGGASNMVGYLQKLYDERFDHIIELSEMQRSMADLRADAYMATVTDSQEGRAALNESAKAHYKRISELMKLCETHCQIANAMKAYRGMEGAWKVFRNESQAIFEQASKGVASAEMLSALPALNKAYKDLSDRAWSMAQAQDRLGRTLYEKATTTYENVRLFGIIGTLGSLVLAAIFVMVLNKQVAVSIKDMTEVMSGLANQELDRDIPGTDRGDEIGKMAAAVQVFKDNAIEVKRLEAERKEAEAQQAQQRHQILLNMADEFDASVGGFVQSVSSASNEMQSSASALSATAEETSKQATTVAGASEEAATNIQTVATASEELSSSITEISGQVAQSTQISSTAVAEVESANERIQGLLSSSQKIGEVVELITDIADQTNLLALNATIEAARAGEAGKGFAVVASEAKNLANQTAKATEEISSQISGIQGVTQDAVHAIESIGEIINQMNEISSAIAAAVEEQGAATQEIARNVEQAASGTKEMSSSVVSVEQASRETGSSAEQMLVAANELSRQSETLRTEVDTFLTNIRNG